jgi:hypothetical protein
VAAALLCFGTFAGTAGAAERTLSRSDVPSMKETRVRDAAVKRAVSPLLRGSIRRAVARGSGDASAFTGDGLSVLAGSVQLQTSRQSRQVVDRWSRARPRPRQVAIGDGGLLASRGKGKVLVLVRAGSTVGLIQLRARVINASRRELTLALAGKLGARLQSANAATPVDDLLDRVRPDGSVSRGTALAAFERLYGAIPGVDTGPAPGDAPVDGNLAVGWVLDDFDALSPAQRNAVEQALGAEVGAARTSSVALRAAARRRKPFTPDAELLEIAKQRAEVYRPLLGQALRLELVVGFVPKFRGVATADAFPLDIDGDLDVDDAGSDAPTRCRIRFSRARWNASGPRERLHAMAHEVFHCFEFQLNPAHWGRTSDVALEGLAEWAAATTVRPYAEPWRTKRVREYFPQPELSLVKQPYSSVFFWGRIEEHDGRPLWDSMPALMATQGFDDLMLVAGAANDKFSEIWPSSFKLDPSMGPAWTTSHPSHVSQADGAAPSVVTDKAPIKAAHYTNRLYSLAPDDEDKVLARVELKQGRARVGATEDLLAGDRIIGAGETVWLCLDETSSCAVCPNGEATEAPTHTDMGKKPVVAVAGGENGAKGTIEFRDPHEKCGFDVGDARDPTDPAYCPRRKHERLPNSRAGALRWHLAATKENQRLLEELLPLRRRLDDIGEQIPERYSPGTPEAEREHRLRNDAWRVELEMWPAWCRHQDMSVDSALVVGNLAKRRTLPGPKHPLVRAVKRFGDKSLKIDQRLIHGYSGMPGHNPLASGRPFPEFP